MESDTNEHHGQQIKIIFIYVNNCPSSDQSMCRLTINATMCNSLLTQHKKNISRTRKNEVWLISCVTLA